MKSYTKIFTACVLALSLSSCNKWLDIMPQGLTTENNLFSDYSGYRSALNGIYQQMASTNLYGRELSWGFMSALSQYYDFSSMNNVQLYTYTEKMDYQNKEVLDYLEGIWQTAYNTIANCNLLISHVAEADPNMFPYVDSGEQDMIYGEALATRALMHFEILRLFAPAPVVDRTSKSIPYSSTYPDKVPTRYTTEEVLAKIVADLQAALPLLEKNDLNLDALQSASMRFSSADSRGLFFDYRGTRLNYWAVKALLARVYMYAGDYTNALATATELYETCGKWFPLTDYSTANALNSGAVKFYDDIIFASYDQYLTDNYDDVMLANQSSTANFMLALRTPKNRFSGHTSYDIRYKFGINQPDEEQENVYTSCKYVKYTNTEGNIESVSNDTQGALIPVIRMSEIIMIIAECQARGASGQGDGDISAAVSTLNNVLQARSRNHYLVSASTFEDFMKELEDEMWKENIGEGQYFFFLKRINSPTLVTAASQTIQMNGKYVFDIPDSETNLLQ